MGSSKFKINSEEARKWIKNTLVFFAPVAVIYLAFVQANVTTDGLAFSDFVPDQIVVGAAILYVINVALDFLRKFVPDTR